MFGFLRREPTAGVAEKLVARGKIERAIKVYRRVLKANPGDSSTLNRVGDLLARVDKYSEAIHLYRQTAELFVEQGFYVKAIAVYKKIHRLDPSQLDVYRKLADLYSLQGLHNDARVHYEVLVDYHDRQGDLGAAIGVCRKLTEIQPEELAHRTRLAELFERRGDHAAVAREYLEIARVMVERGALEQATQVLERAVAKDGGDAEFLTAAARLLRTEGHGEFAETLLAEAEQIHGRAGRTGLVEEVRERLAAHEVPAPEVPAAASPEPPPVPIPAEAGLSLDLDEDVYVLQPVEEAAPAASSHGGQETVEDVLAEIEVFVKYGFREKAHDRLGELLRSEPGNLEAHRIRIELLLQDGSPRAIAAAAGEMAAAAAGGSPEPWIAVRDRLRRAGYLVTSGGIKPPPEIGGDAEEFDLLETGAGPSLTAPATPEPQTDAAGSPESSALFDLLSAPDDAAETAAAPRAEEPAPASPAPDRRGVPDDVDFVVVDDSEFADLAAEVEREMETGVAPEIAESEAPSVEEIVASFKQGVAENLSSEDFDTHYNLGIAYREMGLVEEAIGEFEISIRSRDYRIGSCSLLGLCCRDKGDLDAAVEWYTRGLETPGILEHERHALLYELGEAHEVRGDLEAARTAFAEIQVSDGSYRDVGERLAALG